MLHKYYSYCFILLTTLLFSCNAEQDNNGEQALKDYEEFVTQVERDTAAINNDIDFDSTWIQRTNTLLLRHDSLQNQVIIAKDYYSPEQEQVVKDLGNRFEEAQGKIKVKQQEISKRYKMREELLGLSVQKDDLSSITTTELAPAYKHFVAKVADNYKSYSFAEWQWIEGWWNALNNRMKQVTDELTADARAEIEEAQKEYVRTRQEANIQPTGAEK